MTIDCPYCHRRHYTFNAVARCRYPKAHTVAGEGPWASVAGCRGTTVHLYETEEDATAGKAFIDRLGCGGACHRRHAVVLLVGS